MQSLESKSEIIEKQLTMPEGYVPPEGVKYLPERDLSIPPVHIDVLKGIDNVRNVTLSQLVDDIVYINIGKQRFGATAQMTPYGILVSNFDGAWLYNTDGQLLREIYSNLCEYQPIVGSVLGVMSKTGDKFRGIEQIIYNEKDDRIWLKYRDDEMGGNYLGYLGYLDMSTQLTVSNDEIKQDLINPLGKFSKGKMAYAENFVIHRPFRPQNLLTTNTFRGDTLCCFTFGYDTLKAEILSRIQSGDAGDNYYHQGTYTFRPNCNDTLFRVMAANVLKPVYILDIGNSAIIQERGIDTNPYQLYLLGSLNEDDRYLYLTFSVGNIERKNVRKKWWGLYDKEKREFFTLPLATEGGQYDRGIENDIDGGLPFWPAIDRRGEKYMTFRGMVMKSILTEAWSSKSKAAHPEKKAELKQFMQSVNDDDVILIFVK
jgi:hypothetical protein